MQRLIRSLIPKSALIGAFLLTILLPVSPAGAVSILLNGSFEQGADPGGPCCLMVPAGSGDITGWEVIGHSVDYIGAAGIWPASDGDRSLDLAGDDLGGVQQTFETIVDQMYVVSFDLAGNPFGPEDKVANVSAGDSSVNFSFNTSGSSLDDMNWTPQTFTFTATSTTTTLAFMAVSPPSPSPHGAALDNVEVNAIPEPSTILLLGCGLAGLAALRRRRD